LGFECLVSHKKTVKTHSAKSANRNGILSKTLREKRNEFDAKNCIVKSKIFLMKNSRVKKHCKKR